MRRLRFYVDVTTNKEYDKDTYNSLASILEHTLDRGYNVSDLARAAFYGGDFKVLRKPPRT